MWPNVVVVRSAVLDHASCVLETGSDKRSREREKPSILLRKHGKVDMDIRHATYPKDQVCARFHERILALNLDLIGFGFVRKSCE